MVTVKEKVMAITLIATVIIAAGLILMSTWRISSSGRIKAIGVGVYTNLACTSECHSINWGELKPGDLAGSNVYIKNIRNTNFTLTMNTTAWEPIIAETYLTFDWNYSGVVLEPDQVIAVQMTLYVNPSIGDVDTFSFDINITAKEVE